MWRGRCVLAYRTAQDVVDAAHRVRSLSRETAPFDSGVTVLQQHSFGEEGGAEEEEEEEEEESGVVFDVDGGPYGRFRLRVGTPEEAAMADLPTKRPNTEWTSRHCGMIGIVEVSIEVPGRGGSAGGGVEEGGAGTVKGAAAAAIAEWYSDVFGFHHRRLKSKSHLLVGGPVPGSQCIRIVEVPAADARPFSGDHLCFYVRDFEGAFRRSAAKNALFVNPRFLHLDNSSTMEEARQFQAFRILHMHEVRSGERFSRRLLTEEHEVRSGEHSMLPLLV